MAGSQGTDTALIDLKTKVASDFTTALNTPTKQSAYSGMPANVVVRTMLASVALSTDVNTFPSMIEAAITTVVAMALEDLFPRAYAIV